LYSGCFELRLCSTRRISAPARCCGVARRN